MGSAIVGFQQNEINFLQKISDRVNNLHAHFLHFLNIARDSFCRRFNIGASRWICCHYPKSFVFVGSVISIQSLGEGDAVGGIEADDANPAGIYNSS